jgi:hypothetical protein
MPAPNQTQEIQEVPLELVGGNTFGRYSKISNAQTWNMIVSDDALVPYPGYKNVLESTTSASGRGLYASTRGNIMIAVWGSTVFSIEITIDSNFQNILTAHNRGNMATSTGDVFISENNNGQIVLSDGNEIYVYNWLTPSTNITLATKPAALTDPGFIAFQNGRFIVVNTTSNAWYLSGPNNTTFTGAANSLGALQSKPDFAQAAVPTPGGGNTLMLFGHNVIEQWTDVGNALFPYQRSSTFNVDYGTVNASTIASLDNYIVWLAANEQSGVTIMMINDRTSKSISTEGIDYKLSNLKDPTNCSAFLFRQDGHVLYQFTFITDNVSYVYDTKTDKFFTVSDENNNYHIASKVVFFNNKNYLISLESGNLYEFGTQYTTYDYGLGDIQQIPRLRVTPPLRLPSQRWFIIKSLGFTIENGRPNQIDEITTTITLGDFIATESGINLATENDRIITDEGGESSTTTTNILVSEAVDLSISRDGGESFGSSLRLDMNAVGKRKSRFIYQRLGQANDVCFQIKFIGFGRFVAFNGVAEVYQ